MDFKRVLEELLQGFEKNKVRYALMGGFAMGLWGMGRTTVDLDFLVHKNDLSKVEEIMTALGYECKFQTENVSQYVSPLRVFGEVDFLHAFRQPSLRMLDRAVDKKVFGEMRLKVLRPEDIIGLKLQAIKNNPHRKEREIEDVVFLASEYGSVMDWSVVEEYVKILDVQGLYEELQKRLRGTG